MSARFFQSWRARKVIRHRQESFRPILMGLEDRLVPSTVEWIAGNGDFGTAANWRDDLDNSHHVPGAGDYAIISNSNATVTVGASYSLDHLHSNCRLVLNSGGMLSVANPIDGSSIALLMLNSGATLQTNGVGTSIGQLALNSGATLQTTGGTTTITGSSVFAGTFKTLAGAYLEFTGGMQMVNAGTVFNGPGAYNLRAGCSFNVTGSSQIAGQTNFTLSGGTLGGPGTFEVSLGTTFTWSAGTQAGPGTTQIDKGGSMTLVSGNKKPLDGRVVSNSGTILMSADDTSGMDTGNGALWTNRSEAVFDIETNANIFHQLGGSPGLTINNAGTVRKADGTTTLVGGVVLNNTGTLDLQNGTLELAGGGVNSSTIALGSSATLAISNNSATFTLAPGTAVTGTGLVHITGGHLNVTGNVSVANTILDSGSLDGTGTYTATGTFAWNNGGVGGSGTTIVAAGATLTINGSPNKSLDGHTLQNNGTVTWTGTGQFLMYDAAVINNTGTWNIQTTQATLRMVNQGGLPSTFNNTGTVAKAGDNNAASISIAFNNSAAVAVHNGALNFAGGTATDRSSYSVDAGTTLDLTGGGTLNVSGTISGSGAGVVALSAGMVIVPVAGATLEFDPSILQWTGGTIFTEDGGTLTNMGDMTITGINSKALDTNTPPNLNDPIFTLDNEGTMLWTGTGQIHMYDGVIIGNGIINNGASFDIQTGDQGDGLRMANQRGLPSTFINAGSLTKSAGLAYAHIGIDFENQGSVALSSGGLDLYGGGHSTGNMDVAAGTILEFTAGGVYYLDAGASITDGGTTEVISASTLDVQAAVTATEFVLGNNMGSYGTLQIDDSGMLTLIDPNTGTPYNLTIYNGGVVIEFSGSTPGAGYGRLNIGAAAQLGGNLYVTMLNGYRPAAGTTFQILTDASLTQRFGNIYGTDLGGGLHLTPTYNATDLTLTAVQTGPSPGNGDRFPKLTSQAGVVTGDSAACHVTGLDPNFQMTHAIDGGNLDLTVSLVDDAPGVPAGMGRHEFPPASGKPFPLIDTFFQVTQRWGWDGQWLEMLG